MSKVLGPQEFIAGFEVQRSGYVAYFDAQNPFRPPRRRSPTETDSMASISSKIFTVAEHTPEESEHRATRRFLLNPECLKHFKLSAGELVAILTPENPNAAVGVKPSVYFCPSDVLLTRRTPLQQFSVGVLWPNPELDKHGRSPRRTVRCYYLIAPIFQLYL